MSKTEQQTSNKVFLSVIQGTLRQSVPEGTQNAVMREWEAGGKKGTKWEIEYKAIFGRITNVDFYKGESGGKKFMNLNLTLDENEDGKFPVISVGVKTRYATDIMKKLPNVDLKEEVRIRPYSFQPDGEDKNVTGIEITQRDPRTGNFDKKVSNFFIKKDGEKWVPTNGFPEPSEETRENGDWEDFYRSVTRFLINFTQSKIMPKFATTAQPIPQSKEEEEATPDDIPF